MNKQQMEMLSVKSTIERMVQGYINAFTSSNGSSKNFFDAVERLVASLFVGQQIDNNYLVRSLSNGDLEIRFTTQGHGTHITFMLPEVLKWKIDVRKPQVDENPKEEGCALSWNGAEVTLAAHEPEIAVGTMQYDTTQDKVRIFDGVVWVEISDELRDMGVSDPKTIVLEGTIRIGRTGGLEVYQNGKWVQMPKNTGHGIGASTPSEPSPQPTAEVEEFDPFEAYDRAKKAVKNMV